ncbi:cytochrome b [Rhodoplanes sp. TEM]|uniref:Cytochrome b n=1 Tax=Rhodoplanes tepidamans TaxID=200616 RepID=A0ABT5JH94_RHOTP|nr:MULTISPECIES: cytochrome b [Rhodoplanes]MDC7789084.1 cytochrome b [Rhodoplanes tepidamans]MDC7986671.1 cytochrome b [Rhodoplanes sp. TEM]MDQ0354430.1 cytochrome b561 [Rhodoplanes tepidamans]
MTDHAVPADRFRYDSFTQAVHWLTLIAVAGVFVSGQIMDDMARGPARTQMIGLHVSVGLLVLVMTVLRLARRVAAPQPEPIPGSPLVQMAARAMHLTLYILLVLVPVVGMAMVWAKGRSVGVFGLFTLPPLIAPDRELADRLGDMHEIGATLIVILAGVHALAAIVHHAVLKDGAIARMLPLGAARRG